jgi:type I restriction enzyme S subunit
MKNWEKKKLGELSKKKDAVVSGPFGSNLKVSDYKSEGIPILRLQNIGKGFFIDKDIKFVNEAKAEELKYHSFLSGDIALAKLGIPIGKTCIIPNYFKSGIITADIVRIRPDKNVVDYNFLEYFLNTDLSVNQLTGNISGATRPRVNLSDVRDIEIPLPPLPEQQRIVAILDRCFTAIDRAKAIAKQNLKNATELFESYLNGVFDPSKRSGQGKKGEDWEERKVKDIGFAQTGTTPKTVEKENYGDFIPFIKPADVDFSGLGDIRYDNEGLSEIGLKKGRKMECGSILMVCIGATIGKVGFAVREVSCNQQINTLTINKEFEPKFIYYAMTSKEFQQKVLLEGKGAQATLPIINKSKWENLTISFPKSKTDQQNIVRQLDSLRAETQKLEAVYQKKIADLDELKKSILQKAFSGELNTEVEIDNAQVLSQ